MAITQTEPASWRDRGWACVRLWGQGWAHGLNLTTRRMVTQREEDSKLPDGQMAKVSVGAPSQDWGRSGN